MLTTFGWMCEAEIKAPMCILMTNTGFEKLDCPFIRFFHSVTNQTCIPEEIYNTAQYYSPQQCHWAGDWFWRTTEKFTVNKNNLLSFFFFLKQSHVLKIELYNIFYPIAVNKFARQDQITPQKTWDFNIDCKVKRPNSSTLSQMRV